MNMSLFYWLLLVQHSLKTQILQRMYELISAFASCQYKSIMYPSSIRIAVCKWAKMKTMTSAWIPLLLGHAPKWLVHVYVNLITNEKKKLFYEVRLLIRHEQTYFINGPHVQSNQHAKFIAYL